MSFCFLSLRMEVELTKALLQRRPQWRCLHAESARGPKSMVFADMVGERKRWLKKVDFVLFFCPKKHSVMVNGRSLRTSFWKMKEHSPLQLFCFSSSIGPPLLYSKLLGWDVEPDYLRPNQVRTSLRADVPCGGDQGDLTTRWPDAFRLNMMNNPSNITWMFINNEYNQETFIKQYIHINAW